MNERFDAEAERLRVEAEARQEQERNRKRRKVAAATELLQQMKVAAATELLQQMKTEAAAAAKRWAEMAETMANILQSRREMEEAERARKATELRMQAILGEDTDDAGNDGADNDDGDVAYEPDDTRGGAGVDAGGEDDADAAVAPDQDADTDAEAGVTASTETSDTSTETSTSTFTETSDGIAAEVPDDTVDNADPGSPMTQRKAQSGRQGKADAPVKGRPGRGATSSNPVAEAAAPDGNDGGKDAGRTPATASTGGPASEPDDAATGSPSTAPAAGQTTAPAFSSPIAGGAEAKLRDLFGNGAKPGEKASAKAGDKASDKAAGANRTASPDAPDVDAGYGEKPGSGDATPAGRTPVPTPASAISSPPPRTEQEALTAMLGGIIPVSTHPRSQTD